MLRLQVRIYKERLDTLFCKLMRDSVSNWMRLAEERLKESGAKCYVSPGNDATFAIDPIIQLSDYVIYPEGKVVVIDDQHEMTGRGSKALSRSAEPFA